CAFVAKPLRLPADLAALLGPGAPPLPESALDPAYAARNGGADPLALRDDLMHAFETLTRAGPPGLDYAVRFVQGLARCAGDQGLDACAREARRAGDVALLLATLSERAERAGRALPI